MTQQYLAGELSLRLAQLQAADADQGSVSEIMHLRHEAETGPISGLASVVMRALHAADDMCWRSLERGDTVTFARDLDLGAELREFGIAAGLLDGGNDVF